MRNLAFTILAPLTALSALAAPVHANPDQARSDNAALILTEGACRGFVPTSTGGKGAPISSPDHHRRVITAGGVINMVCHFDVEEGLRPARVTRASEFACGTGYGTTYDSMMMVNSSGQGLLVCRVREQG